MILSPAPSGCQASNEDFPVCSGIVKQKTQGNPESPLSDLNLAQRRRERLTALAARMAESDVVYRESYNYRYHSNRWTHNLTKTQRALLEECRRQARERGYDGTVAEFQLELEVLCREPEISVRAAQEAFKYGVMPFFVQVLPQYVPDKVRGGMRQVANIYRVHMTDPVHPDDLRVPAPPPSPRPRRNRRVEVPAAPAPPEIVEDAAPHDYIAPEFGPAYSHNRSAEFADQSSPYPKGVFTHQESSLIVEEETGENETKSDFEYFVDSEVRKIEQLTKDAHSTKGFANLIRRAFQAGKGRYVGDALDRTRHALEKAAQSGNPVRNAGAYFTKILTGLLADAQVFIVKRNERSEQVKIRQTLRESIPAPPVLPTSTEQADNTHESRQDEHRARSAPNRRIPAVPPPRSAETVNTAAGDALRSKTAALVASMLAREKQTDSL